METDQQTFPLADEKAISPPKPMSCDGIGEDILQDTYFDHKRPLDSNALDALLNTKFNTSFDDVEDDLSTSVTAGQWRPAHSETLLQQQSPSRTRLELSSHFAKRDTLQPTQPGSQFAPYSPEAQVTSHFGGLPYHGHAPANPYEQHNVLHNPHAASLSQMPNHIDQGRFYPTSGPVAMPTMTDVYPEVPAPVQQFGYFSPSNASRQGTADLMDYENTIHEEDESGEGMNGENADPCYAQLLYRCLRDAPDHTMALKDVYKWVRQYSQKARDSAGTGWQNSVRHNLSMNAAFERVASSAIHGPKKGSLWRLTRQALQDGVISTTRYRKDPKRKPERRSSPALKRQISGAKGGQATRAASAHKRAMQARALGRTNISGFERHRRALRQQEPVFLTPTSMPNSNRATASPASGWMPHGLPSHLPHSTSLPASPYFVQSVENDSFGMGPAQSMLNPHTPPEIHIGFSAPPKASPATTFDSPSKGFLNEFELAYHDQAMSTLFPNHDDFGPNTPSLGTEMSFTADDMTPMSRLSVSVEPMRS
ncbi:hypothetical protein MBLNU13_g01212t1 [Cladosporium sp. NU13]